MTAVDLLKKAATVIRLQLACMGIQGQALYDCAISEAAMDVPASIGRASSKFRAHALMRQHLLGDPGPGDLSGKLNSMTAEAIAQACEDAASSRNVDKLEGFDPSAARNPKHWSDNDD